MPRQCTVCTHAQLAEIDYQLLLNQISLSALGRQYDVSRDALRSHRQRHQTALLAQLRASPDAWTMSQVWGEIWRLHQIGWDELARAQRGEVVGVDQHGEPVRRVSSAAVSLMIGQVRKHLDFMARTAAFRGTPNRTSRARPTGAAPTSPRRSSRGQSRNGRAMRANSDR